MTIVVPNTGSLLSGAGAVTAACGCWSWVGLTTLTASGSVTWYRTNACTSGCEIIAISLAPQQSALFGPFNSPCGLYAGGVACGFAVVWIKTPPGT